VTPAFWLRTFRRTAVMAVIVWRKDKKPIHFVLLSTYIQLCFIFLRSLIGYLSVFGVVCIRLLSKTKVVKLRATR